MATIVGYGRIVVTKARNVMQVDTYDNELHAVLCMIDNGSLGGGNAYGNEKHMAALNAVEAKIAEVRKNVADEAADSETED